MDIGPDVDYYTTILEDILVSSMGSRSRKGVKLVRDFLVPSLDAKRYPGLLEWVERNEGEFRIFWRHQSSSNFRQEDAAVFRDWSVLKDKWQDDDPKAITNAKQRFRAALQKLSRSLQHISTSDEYRIYRIKNVWLYISSEQQTEATVPGDHLLNAHGFPDIDFSQFFTEVDI